MAQQTYIPGQQFQAGYGLHNANAERAPILQAGQSAYTLEEIIHLEKVVFNQIFDTAPQGYEDMKLILGMEPMEVGSRQFSWTEHGYGRNPGVVVVGAGAQNTAQPAVASTQVEREYVLSTASVAPFIPDSKVVFPTGEQGFVKTQNTATGVITVKSLTGKGLPLVAVGDLFSYGGIGGADGMNRFSGHDRLATVTRWNYMEKIGPRTVRWDRIERQEWINNARTNYMQADAKERLRQLRADIQQRFWLGIRGESSLSQNEPLTTMNGIQGFLDSYGAAYSSVPVQGLKEAFESLAFATDHLKEGSVRYIFAHPRVCYALSQAYKATGLRYAPNDRIGNLNLFEYQLGMQRYVVVPCPLFGEASIFPKSWMNRLFVLDLNCIKPVRMKGIPMMEMDIWTDDRSKGAVEDYTIGQSQAFLSCWFKMVLGSFYMDITF